MIGTHFGQYRVEEQLGQGGMGIVYRAHDEKLGRTVALKFLPPHLQSDDLSKQRFIQEAQAASALDDPHICTIHDVGETEDGRLYIVMAYYEGQTLKYRLKDGSLDTERALNVAYQIALGLATAHEHGIVHRDIKPANVMVTEKGSVKILDFGLAKLGESSDITRAGSTLGTTAYMSPEQARGVDVDGRTDVWSLGVLLYEMLTGETPFSGGYEAAIMYSILNEGAPTVISKRPDVSQEVSRLVARCLEKDVADRYASASELASELRRLSPSIAATDTHAYQTASPPSNAISANVTSTIAKFTLMAASILAVSYVAMLAFGLPGWVFPLAVLVVLAGVPVVAYGLKLENARARMDSRERSTQRGLRGWLDAGKALKGGILASTALAVVVAGAAGLRAAGIGPFATLITSGELNAESRFVVADFNNRTNVEGLGETVTEAFRIDLSRSTVVSLLDRSAIRSTLELMELPPDTSVSEEIGREIAIRRGAAAVVSGDIQPAGAGFVLTARVAAAEDGTELAAMRENAADDASLLGAIDRLSARLREEIGESLVSIRANQPLESVTTASLEALREYSQGEADASAGRLRESIRHLERAVELDSTFAMAFRKLAVMHGNAGDRLQLQLDAIEKAYSLRKSLPDRERLLTEAYYFGAVLSDDERQKQSYEAVLQKYPDDVTALNNLSLVYLRERRYEDATRLLRTALKVAEGWTMRGNLVDALVTQGKFDEVERELAAFDQALPGNAFVPGARSSLALLAEDFEDAYAWTDSVVARQDTDLWRRRASGMRRDLYLAQGRLRESERLHHEELNRRLSDSDSVGAMFREFGELLESTAHDPQPDVIRSGIDRILARYAWESFPVQARPYTMVAFAYAYINDPQDARRWLQLMEANVPPEMRTSNQFPEFVRGLILAREKRFDEGLALMEGAYERSGCVRCLLDILGITYQAAGYEDKAIDAFERFRSAPTLRSQNDVAMDVPVLERLSELYAVRGEYDKAIDALSKVVSRWKLADPELQPRVREAESRIEELLLAKAREPASKG